MPKAPKENELLGKAENFPSYREKCDKILAWRNKNYCQVIGKNMTLEDRMQLQDIETQTRLKLEEIDDVFAKACYPI